MGTFEKLQKDKDIKIGDETYRVSPHDLRIKYCGPGQGWKILRKFKTVEELAAYWHDLSEPTRRGSANQAEPVVVRECVEASTVLPPEQAPAGSAVVLKCDGACVQLDRYSDTASVVLVLNDGWSRAQNGLAAILRFGATLLAVAEWLEKDQGDGAERAGGHGGDRRSGTGLKGWLEKHCPEINYKTAYGYMCAASGLRREARLADDVPLLSLMGENPVPDARAEKLRARINRIIGDSTLGLLREAARETAPGSAKGGARDGAGRPEARRGDSAVAAGAAWAEIGGRIDRATAWHFERFLPEAVAREALATVELLKSGLEERLREIGKGT